MPTPEIHYNTPTFTRMPAEAPRIKQLPESVAIRLRSTLAITTLSDAISELIQNSLDAHARNIKIQVNLSRNSCVVEDDGVGIAPVDVSMVGKMYATSKYPLPPNSSPTTFGFRGQALSSLATHSLFTLASRHREHRSTHTVRISYSTPIFTGLAPEHLRLPDAGTVVRIEGLWGDMPVRFKARLQEDFERGWEGINRTIVQLLLTPQGKGVGVIARDDTGNRRLLVKDGKLGTWELNVLRQAYGREVIGPGWERVRAQQGGVRIEGWICTKGSGTKGLQFLYINNHPLRTATTLLHGEINRILAASSFGVIEDDENKKSRNGPKKGVEKYGMFILRIGCVNSDISVLGGEGGTEGKSGLEGDHLKSVINLLQKLVREFLKTHHFRPFSMTTRKDDETMEAPPSVKELVQRGSTKSRSRSSTPLSTISNSSTAENIYGDSRALAIWSRVKSAKVDPKEEEGRQGTGFQAKELTFSTPVSSGAVAPIDVETASVKDGLVGESGDEHVTWTNPRSRKSFQVNTRTGNTTRRDSVRPSSSTGVKRPVSMLSIRSGRPGDKSATKRLRRSENTDTVSKGTFVEQLLKNWDNPVFKPTEAPIPSLTTGAQLSNADLCNHGCTDGFAEATSTTLGKLTKDGLRNAEVIAQVDKKYILIKIHGISTGTSEKDNKEPELLVIVDQHAADERVRVESLFADICKASSSADGLHAPEAPQKLLVYKINRREWDLMHRYQSVFKEWGINYRLSPKDEELSLHIYSLPVAISERCANEPTLAVDMIRKHVYELSEKRTITYNYNHGVSDWVKRIESCPKGLVDMVNSKACRSAIMFNDPLELEECKALVGKLAKCRFPFQCAHGRPSMIPLVDLRVSSAPEKARGGGGFKKDFERWMRETEAEG